MSEEFNSLASRGQKVIMNTYSRYPIAFDYGEGVYLYDTTGKKYLDFVAGIAVNSLGTGYNKLVSEIANQAKYLIHVSNLYYTKPQIELAEKLCKYSDFNKVFFCNSGAEANEAALKLCRKYAVMKNKGGREIITMKKSFHGRTYGAITATGQDKYHIGLDPMLPEVSYAEYNNFDSVLELVSDKTCAIMVEAIQGEGGVIPAKAEFLRSLRRLCDERDILLVFDEVQTGVGRCGELFCYQCYGVVPDVVTLAKGLAGGVPIGAMLTKDSVAEAFKPGDHASTFGGNPLATGAGNIVIDEIMENGILENVKRQGEYLTKRLNELKAKYPCIIEVRGMGLMQGIELNTTVAEVVKCAIGNGLLVVGAGPNVIRFVPALIITKEQIDEAYNLLDKSFSEVF